jgi:hypothetical protein
MARHARFFLGVVLIFFEQSIAQASKLGVLTPDYGILADNERLKILDDINPECWRFSRECPTEYWQCFPLRYLSLGCEITGTLDGGEPAVAPSINVRSDRNTYEFFTRRPWMAEDCQENVKQWTNLLVINEVACFSASIVEETKVKGSQGRSRKFTLQLGKIKTLRGRWSYFCDPDWGDICS